MSFMSAFKTENGSKFGRTKIAGYVFGFFTASDGYTSYRAPYGDTLEDKQMFDTLVYNNKMLYQGKNRRKIAQDIRQFIIKYKK